MHIRPEWCKILYHSGLFLLDFRYEKYLSTHDSLTGLYNKSYFFERTRAILQKNPDEEYVLISVKLINYNFITKVFGNLLVNQFIIKLFFNN